MNRSESALPAKRIPVFAIRQKSSLEEISRLIQIKNFVAAALLWRAKFKRLTWLVPFILALVVWIAPTPVSRALTLQWDAVQTPDVAGYRLYYGQMSGVYTEIIDVGNTTTARVSDLLGGVSYYFAVTAYDSDGFESILSSEIKYLTPLSGDAPLVQLTYPLNGATYVAPANISMAATVISTSQMISKVQFYSGADLLGESTAPPFSFTSTGISAGIYNLSAVAIDLLGNQVTSQSITVTVTDPAPAYSTSEYLTGEQVGTLRNGFNGFSGMQIVVGSAPITITALGRMMADGNSDTHVVKLVNAGDGTDVPGGAVSVGMAGGSIGQFQYSDLSTPVVLAAGAAYYIVSQETAGGDFWYYDDTTVTTASVATEASAVWGDNIGNWRLNGGPGQSFGPVDFKYVTATTPSQVNPPPVSPPSVNPPAVLTPGQYVTSSTPGTLRNGYSGFAGMQIMVGSVPISVSALGRMMANSNTGTHTIKLVNASDGTDVPGGSVTIMMAGGTIGQFQYADLSAPVVLSAGSAYYVVSQEIAGGDSWYFDDTTVTTSSGATEISAVWGDASQWHVTGAGGQSFGPLDFKYSTPPISTPSSTPPTTPPATAVQFITSSTPATPRNGFSGFVGMQIIVGDAPITVTGLGRMMADGNTDNHTVKLVNANDGTDVPGGAVSISMNGGTVGQFQYVDLSTPIVLSAGAAYYLVSQETTGGDSWFYNDTIVTTTSAASEVSAAWSNGSGKWHINGAAGQSFGPLDFKYLPH